MKFRTKMILVYSTFIMIIAILTSCIFFYYMSVRYRESAYHTLKLKAIDMSYNYELQLNRMNSVMKYITSNVTILENLQVLSNYHSGNISNLIRDDAESELAAYINNDYMYTTSYRTLIYNRHGDAIATKDFGNMAIRKEWKLDEIMGAIKAIELPGKTFIVKAHADEWGAKSQPYVFSIIKCLNGDQFGFIEVQCLVESIEFFENDDEEIAYLIYNDEEELLYASTELETEVSYEEYIKRSDEKYDDREALVCSLKNEKHDFTVIAVYQGKQYMQEFFSIIIYSILVGICFIIVSILFVFASSKYLTKPIDELRLLIDKTRIENLRVEGSLPTSNNEIEAVVDSYQNLLKRLRDSITKERKISDLNLRTQLDMLQSQIHPHFIYNVLNVISNRGVLNNDIEICNICGSLASMLRYATDTREKVTSVKNEVNYLNQYCTLIKARYAQKIEFVQYVDDEVQKYKMPKAILQQLVENCIEHGFKENGDGLKVKIEIRGLDNGWQICVHDNGVGFAEQKIVQLEKMFFDINKRASCIIQI